MINFLFPTPVLFEKIFLPTNLITKEVLDLQKKVSSTSLLSGHAGSRIDITNEILEDYHLPNLSNLLNLIQKNITNYCNQVNLKNQYIVHSWINFNPTHAYNRRHCHPGSTVSGVFYIKYPKDSCSPISFFRSREYSDYGWSKHLIKDIPEMNSSLMYTPKEGELILFPSYLEHEVSPNKSKEDRISMSFNCAP
jgi:uncharacterized protein (TIGR02466 family)